MGTETWLRPDIMSSEIFPSIYTVYRKDRQDGYGGVLVAIKNNITSEELKVDTNTESIFIKLTSQGNKTTILGCLFRPPSSDINYIDNMCTTIETLYQQHLNSVIWLAGDLNLPDIDWNTTTTK